jgi:hypothetical protein
VTGTFKPDRIVLVCGGRDYADAEAVNGALDKLRDTRGLGTLVHGACHKGGADLLAHYWARERNVAVAAYPVDHRLDGPWPAAGPNRNRRMLTDARPDCLVAFPGGSGTEGMVKLAEVAGVPVWRPAQRAGLSRSIVEASQNTPGADQAGEGVR